MNGAPQKQEHVDVPQEYSNHVIEMVILICQVFPLQLRQTEGFMNSLTRLMNAAI